MTRTLSVLALGLCLSARADLAPIADVQTQLLARHTMNSVLECFGSVVVTPAAIDHLNVLFAAHVDSLAVQKGEHVVKGQKLIDLSPDPGVVQSYVQAKNQRVLASQNLVQQKQLLAAQLATQASVDAASKSLKDAELALQTLHDEGADQSSLSLSAPFSGNIEQVAVAVGDHVAAAATLLSLAMDERLQAQLQIDPQDAQRLRPGMSVHLGDVFSAHDQESGSIDNIARQVDASTHKLSVSVRLNNTHFLAGTPVRAHVILSSDSLLAVPRAAILNDTQGSFIYVVDQMHAHRIAVQAGRESNGWVGVSGPLTPGMHVVILGNYELQEGMATRETLLP